MTVSPLPPRNFEISTPRGIKTALVDAEHQARATELKDLGLDRKADRVLACGTDARGQRRCKQRVCPTCAAHQARRNAARAARSSNRFTRPCFITLTVGPRSGFPLGLRDGLESFKRALVSWKRQPVVQLYVKGAVGGLEPKFSARPIPRWLVHAHLIADCTPDADFDQLAKAWEAATQGKGRLLVPPRLGPDVQDPLAAAGYLTKHVDWSPTPGALAPGQLGALFQHTKGRRLFLQWGTGRAR